MTGQLVVLGVIVFVAAGLLEHLAYAVAPGLLARASFVPVDRRWFALPEPARRALSTPPPEPEGYRGIPTPNFDLSRVSGSPASTRIAIVDGEAFVDWVHSVVTVRLRNRWFSRRWKGLVRIRFRPYAQGVRLEARALPVPMLSFAGLTLFCAPLFFAEGGIAVLYPLGFFVAWILGVKAAMRRLRMAGIEAMDEVERRLRAVGA